MTMKTSQNKVNLDTINKPLPVYKNMDNSMNSLTLNSLGKINTNLSSPILATHFLPSITQNNTSSIQPSIQTNRFLYGMLSNIQNNTNCGSCGGSK